MVTTTAQPVPSQLSPLQLENSSKNEKELQVLEVPRSEKINFSLNSFSMQNLKKKIQLKYLEERQVLSSSPRKQGEMELELLAWKCPFCKELETILRDKLEL